MAAAQSGAEGITAAVPGVGKFALCRQFEKEVRTAMDDGKPLAVVAKDATSSTSRPSAW